MILFFSFLTITQHPVPQPISRTAAPPGRDFSIESRMFLLQEFKKKQNINNIYYPLNNALTAKCCYERKVIMKISFYMHLFTEFNLSCSISSLGNMYVLVWSL